MFNVSDFKKRYTLNEPVEVLDFYQLICFLLQIPAQPHSGSWDHIEEMLNVSAAYKTVQSIPIFYILMATVIAKFIYS